MSAADRMGDQRPESDAAPPWRLAVWMLCGATPLGLHVMMQQGLLSDFAWHASLGAAFLAAVVVLPRTSRRPVILYLMVAAVLMRAPVMVSGPAEGADYHRYFWDGAVVARGGNPYQYTPNEALHGKLQDPAVAALAEEHRGRLRRVTHPHLRTLYPPGAQAIFAAAHGISPFSLTGLRVMYLVCEVAIVLATIALLRSAGKPLSWLTLYAWNPLVISETYNGAHVDIVAAAGVVLALWCLSRRRVIWAAAALGLAVSVKLWPVVLVFFLVRVGWRSWGRLSTSLLVLTGLAAASLLPIMLSGNPASQGGLEAYALTWQGNNAAYVFILRGMRRVQWSFGTTWDERGLTRLVCAAAAMAACAVLALRARLDAADLCRRASSAVLIALLLSPVLFPWYLLPVSPATAVGPGPATVVAAVALPFCYHGSVAGHWLIHGALWALLIGGGVRAHLRRRTPRVARAEPLPLRLTEDRGVVKVIIPALNEAASIGKVLSAVPDWVDEVIVVDNGSTDATAELARQAGATVVAESRRGYGQACLTGIATTGDCDIVVFLDADFSDYPEQMNRLVDPIAAGLTDMVIGDRASRAEPGALTAVQRCGNALACFLMNLFWRTTYRDLGPFRAIRAGALRAMRMCDRDYGWTIEMQIKAARTRLRVLSVPVGYRRRIGRSKISGTVRGVFCASWKILWTLFRYALGAGAVGGDRRCGRVIVFSRFPLPGQAKTRLIPAIGPAAAASLQRRMTARTLETVRAFSAAGGAQIAVQYTGGTRRRMRRWLGGGVTYCPQSDGDLGRRMADAFDRAFADGCDKAVVVGTDCPDLTERHLAEALAALDGSDMVLGPSRDGGYWLIALRRKLDVFDDVAWSTPDVLARTLKLARNAGASVALLDELDDVDAPEDLAHRGELRPLHPEISVVIPALNERSYIQRAIASARADGAEVIVVDGGSTDGTAEAAHAAGAVVAATEPSRAAQMNHGAALAGGRVLLFLHADTLLPENYVRHVFAVMADPHVVGGAFEHRTDLGGAFMAVSDFLVRLRSHWGRMPYGDQALFVRRDVFAATGGFELRPFEDLRFVRQLKRWGDIVIAPAAAVTSARRWKRMGRLRTMMVNQAIVIGTRLGVSDETLLKVYRRGRQSM